MEYNKDSAKNEYLQIPLGWDAPEFNLRITYVADNKSVRLNKSDGKNHIYPGPEFDHQHIPKLIEALAKIYNDKN
ncbi:MAG: hypothetical protein H6586_06235 [Flavobacteriales bacterium]|nr:hypothetical protein [Flavobacteriales bacterium]